MSPASQLTVTPAEEGQKLLQFLERRLRGVPRSALMRFIRTGQVRVDKARAKPFDRLAAGALVRVPPHRSEAEPQVQLPHLPVLYRDEELVAVAKPAGLAAHAGTGHSDSADARLKAMFRDADFPPALVHRLDRDTSGILLAALTHAALRRMADAFRSGLTTKIYLAWVEGRWPGAETEIMQDRLMKSGAPGHERVQAGQGRQAKAAVRPLAVRGDASLLAVRLVTGRTHQIRVQLAQRGHPVCGDPKYGKGGGAMFLHAWILRAPGLSVCCPPPWTSGFAVPEAVLYCPADHEP